MERGDVVGTEGHSRRKVQSAFQDAASGLVWLVNNGVWRSWAKVDRAILWRALTFDRDLALCNRHWKPTGLNS